MAIEQKPIKTIFLFGAGASRDAGIPTINELTAEFVSDPANAVSSFMTFLSPESEAKIKSEIEILSNVTKKFLGKTDLELIMSLILRLEDTNERELLEAKFIELKNFDEKRLHFIKELLQSFIRKKCEDIKSVDYLWPLEGMSKSQKLNIFTLNYDATIEIFCENKGIEYTDGFEPDWNSERFDDKDIQLNIFKLHGSLYWFRTKSNKTIKVPMKGLQTSLLKYLTDEEVSEMMIYPTLEKNKQSGVYSWLSQKFKDELNHSDVCVVMGYSFRDGDIKESILESLSSNHNLWLIIASPHASEYKKEIFSYDNSIAARIVTMDMDMISALTDRTLNSYLSRLSEARSKEEKAWENQSTSQTRFDADWRWILINYLKIGHHDRVKWLVEELSQRRFTDSGDYFPDIIEGVVGPVSLQYILDYYGKNEQKKLDIWKKIFVDYCSTLEYGFFNNSIQEMLNKNNPVKKDELPFWFTDSGSQPRDNIMKFRAELKNIQKQIQDDKLKSIVGKLIQTTHLFVGDNRQLENSNPGELVGRLRTDDLGLKKCATEIIQLLKPIEN